MSNDQTTQDSILTHSGLKLRVRPIRPDDAPHLLEIFEHMSSDSRYRRFNQPVDNLSEERKWQEADRIAQAIPRLGGGFIVFADLPEKSNVAVAAIRYVCTGDGEAETAISVIDAMQRQGIGTQLMEMLVDLAQQKGVSVLTAEIRNDNEGIWKILYRLPYDIERRRDGPYSQVKLNLTRRKQDGTEDKMVKATVS